MMSNPIEYKKNVKSQWGEDGIIEEIFRRIGTTNKLCVEIGAWDGEYLSNTWNLWHNHAWSAILVEGNEQKANELKQKVSNFDSVQAIHQFIEPQGFASLDNVLSKSNSPSKFDLLSIDIDGDDYYIFKNTEKFHSRVLVIEYNPTIPPEIELVQAPGEYFGASALAIVNLANSKGYRLVCCTETNCFFVLDDQYKKLEIEEPKLEDIFPRLHLTYVVTAQDGSAFLNREPTYTNTKRQYSLLDFFKRYKKSHPKLASDRLLPIEFLYKK